MRTLLALTLLLLLTGCTITHDRTGDDEFLRHEIVLQRGDSVPVRGAGVAVLDSLREVDARYGHATDGLHRDRVVWRKGVTTAQEVARDLGPPDRIQVHRNGDLWFIYHFRDTRSSVLVLAYYLKLLRRETINSVDSTLLVVFDRDDKLLYYGADKVPPEELMRYFD